MKVLYHKEKKFSGGYSTVKTKLTLQLVIDVFAVICILTFMWVTFKVACGVIDARDAEERHLMFFVSVCMWV